MTNPCECNACQSQINLNTIIETYTLEVTAPLKEEITFLRSVLTQIAEEDYRGNEPWTRQLAKRALREYSGAVR